jgi:hypothetical protein
VVLSPGESAAGDSYVDDRALDLTASGKLWIIYWLAGYDEQTLQQQIDKKVDFEAFFARAPRISRHVSKITGMICGYRVEQIEDKLMQQMCYLDQLVDELARGKAMDKILRK